MDDFIKQIQAITYVVENICIDVEQNDNYIMVPELMNLLETVLPKVFSVNNEAKIINNEEILEVLNDMVNAFENNDSVLMTDVLRYGLNYNLNKYIDTLNIIEGGPNE